VLTVNFIIIRLLLLLLFLLVHSGFDIKKAVYV
jgi:hypothetical protein